ncbi:hypothetical protein L3X38_003509 [Prunus dulcis]|uniref:Uncharacterized protein n=1 Tax=Prunus dulcis TaxID=3755 RepID=A0AAD4ZM73_PRUDU|nr:hypothetical protein L3X38_003509 [Prunus dulcis]
MPNGKVPTEPNLAPVAVELPCRGTSPSAAHLRQTPSKLAQVPCRTASPPAEFQLLTCLAEPTAAQSPRTTSAVQTLQLSLPAERHPPARFLRTRKLPSTLALNFRSAH